MSACASGAEAIGYGIDMIKSGRADIVLACGTEAAIMELNSGAFAAMRAVSLRNDEPERASRPFDKGRDGFVLGEGAGIVVLESEAHAAARGARVYAVAAGPATANRAAPVLVDYGHNAAALHATGQLVTQVWEGAPTAAITLPGDRRDDLVAESAQAIAAWFGKVVMYEDDDPRGREPGEMRSMIVSALRQARPGVEIRHADGPDEALREAMALAAGGPVLFLYEKLDSARSALDLVGAIPWPEEDLMGELVPSPLAQDLTSALQLGDDDTESLPVVPLSEPESARPE